MLGKHFAIVKNSDALRTSSCFTVFGRRLHKTQQQKSFKYLLNITPKRYTKFSNVFQVSRHQSTKSGSKNNIPLFLGIAGCGVGGMVATYLYSRKSEPAVIDDKVKDVPYVHPNLQEDLALLKEYGPVPYLIVGGGTAAHSAFRSIRTKDPTAKIVIIGEEGLFPYLRPPLSKEMWYDNRDDGGETLTFSQYDGKKRSLFYEVAEFYFSIKDILENKNGGVSVIRGKKVIKVDPESQIVYLDKNEQIAYSKCLVATGSKPKNLPVFQNAPAEVQKHVTLFRTINDFQKLDKISKKIKSVVIVGGGYLGSELACGLGKRGKVSGLKVTQLFPESSNLGNVLPEYLGKWTLDKVRAEGVEVIPDMSVISVTKDNDKLLLKLSNDQILTTEHVIVAVGGEPNTDIASTSGLEIDEKHGGFLVNAEMEARKNLWIAGDSSCFYDMKLGRRRVEHHDHAVVSGKLAGGNMAGDAKPYTHQSMFWSDLGPDIGFEGIGNVDSSLPTLGVFTKDMPTDDVKSGDDGEQIAPDPGTTGNDSKKERYDKGIIFYLKDNIIVGIVLWNIFSKMSIARKIINESKTSDDVTEIAKLFKLYAPDPTD